MSEKASEYFKLAKQQGRDKMGAAHWREKGARLLAQANQAKG
jgi:hypothetical protein